MPAKKIDDERMRQLVVDEGLGPTAVVTLLRAEGTEISPAAVCRWKTRNGIAPKKPRHEALVPWKVKDEHRRLFAIKMLRREAKRRLLEEEGKSLPEHLLPPLNEWKRKMAEADVVLHYEPDTHEGFFYLDRRPGIDLDLIREPD